MSKSYVAVAPLVIAKDESGHDVYIYAGQPVPSNVSAEEISRLLEGGFILEVTSDEPDSVEVPDGEPADSWTVAQLKAYAEQFDIDLGAAKSKPEVLAAVLAGSK